jgi:hypothetical protein
MSIYTNEIGKVVTSPTGKIHTNNEYKIQTDGLILWLDGEDAPVSGYWVDRQGNYDCTIEGDVTHQTNNGGVYRIGTSGNDHLYNNDINSNTDAFTIIGAARYLQSGGQGRLYSNSGGSVNFALGLGNSVLYFYANGWVGNGSENNTNWNIMCISNNSDRNNSRWLRNNTNPPPEVIYSGTLANFSGPKGISFGNESNGSGSFSEHSNCEIGFYLVYNRVLSTEEVTQNYNYYKDRYGL